VLYITDRTRTQ